MAMGSPDRSRLGLGLVLVAALALGVLALYLGLTRPPSPMATAERFLQLVARGRAEEAYAEMAPALSKRTTAGILTLEARRKGLTSYANASWDEIDVKGDEATLEGSVTTRSGNVIDVVMQLVRLENRWRVSAVTLTPPEDAEPADQSAPDG
jgi:hypothetical protein